MNTQRLITAYINAAWEICEFPANFRLGNFLCRLRIGSAVPDEDRFRLHALREVGGIYLALSLLAGFGPDKKVGRRARQAILSQGAQIASHVVSVIRLTQVGLDVQARIIARSCVESSDLLVLCQTDDDVAQAFVKCGSSEEANEFWHRYCSKSRAEKAISKYISEYFPTMEESRKAFLAWRGRESKAMGWAVHPSHMSGAASLFEWEPNLQEIAGASLERSWSKMSSRTLDYLLSSLGSSLGDLNLVVTAKSSGLTGHLPMPRKKLSEDVRLCFRAGQNHLPAVHFLTNPGVLDADNVIEIVRRQLGFMRKAISEQKVGR